MNAGGTIHKLIQSGAVVSTTVLASHTTFNGDRLLESNRAQIKLGIVGMEFAGGIDTKLADSKAMLIDLLDSKIKIIKPDTVITHFHADTHQDHAACYDIVMAAARCVPNILLFKPTFPSGRPDIPFHPNFISKLSDENMIAKISAMSEFVSQRNKYGEDKWLESLKSTAAGDAWTYGGFHGYAEIFQVSRLMG
jgi:LmbE family N-acetylglucosaminyl deacetylase